MTGSFKSNLPYNSFLLFIYGLLLKWPIFTHPLIPVSAADDTFLYKTIIHSISFTGNNFPLLYSIIVFLLLYIQAIGINTIINYSYNVGNQLQNGDLFISNAVSAILAAIVIHKVF